MASLLHKSLMWLLAVLCATLANAQSLKGVNGTSPFNPTNQSEQVGLLISRVDGMGVPRILTLYALTEASLQDLPNDGLSGTIFPAATSNIGNITSASVAWISCDASDYPGYQDATDVLEQAVSNNATALLYSRVNAYCNFTAGGLISPNYNRLFSMTNARDSGLFQNMLSYMPDGEAPHVVINVQEKLQQDNSSNGNGGSGYGQGQPPGGPSPSTAVAMIILYSITGVITALFLIIIITGAVRAHRHPERYGPRAMLGRARQSRAKGLARAMLDSIPIVKFGDDEGDIPKPNDVEMTAHGEKEGLTGVTETAESHKRETSAKTREEEDLITDAAATSRPSYESESGIRANTARVDATSAHPDHEALGCSICTEDFERGEDVRVLPCNHKFHPPCIDPWLLNVSGTCPLCRIDLRPPTSHDAEDADAEQSSVTGGAPDVVTRLGVPASNEEGTSSRRASHRLSFIFDPLNRRRMQDASPEERIEALRQYSERQRSNNEDSRRRRVSNRLSALIGRSRAQDSSSVHASGTATPVPTAAEPTAVHHTDHSSDTHPDNATAEGESLMVPGPASSTASRPHTPVTGESTPVARASNPAAGPSTSPVAEPPTPAESVYEEAPEHGGSHATKSG